MGLGEFFGGGLASNLIKDPFGISGAGNIGISFGANGPSISANFNQLLKKKMNSTSVKGELRELYKSSVASPIVFPLDLDNDHYMLYEIVERKRLSAGKNEYGKTLRTIVLPVPSNLQVSYGANWETQELKMAGAAAAGRLGGQDVMGAVEGLLDIGGGFVQTAANAVGLDKGATASPNAKKDANDLGGLLAATAGVGLATAIGAKMGGGAGALLGAVAGGAENVLAGAGLAAGVAINPHLATLFRGVNMRSFSFNYRLIARNKQESDVIKQLINALKYHMHPGYLKGSQLAFDYPAEFKLRFSPTIAPYLFKINDCVLKDLQVNYAGENTPAFFERPGEGNQAPVIVEIAMTFVETKILTRENFPEGLTVDDTTAEAEPSEDSCG